MPSRVCLPSWCFAQAIDGQWEGSQGVLKLPADAACYIFAFLTINSTWSPVRSCILSCHRRPGRTTLRMKNLRTGRMVHRGRSYKDQQQSLEKSTEGDKDMVSGEVDGSWRWGFPPHQIITPATTPFRTAIACCLRLELDKVRDGERYESEENTYFLRCFLW